MFTAVYMASKSAALLFYLTIFGQRKDLEAATVGQQRSFPSVELMKASGLAQQVASWTQIEVIRIT